MSTLPWAGFPGFRRSLSRGSSMLQLHATLLALSLAMTGCGVGSSSRSVDTQAASSAGTQSVSPPAPTQLHSSAGNAQIALAWSASSGATSYNVKRATTNGGPYQPIAASATDSYTDAGLTNGTIYYYVVSALDASGESSNSAQVSAMPTAPAAPQPAQIPAIPTALAAVAGNAQVRLAWSASAGATAYHVKRATSSGGPFMQLAAPTSAVYGDTAVSNGTTYYYVVSALNGAGESGNSAQVSAGPVATTANVTVTVNPANTAPISPYIYGINEGTAGAPPDLTFARAGGNRWTAYNWENNASNAGSDYLYENDAFLSSSTTAAEAVRSFIADNLANNMASLITFQMQGLVSGDESGPVSTASPPALGRFKQVANRKISQSSVPFTLNPPTTDANVYMDEFIWALDQKFAGQSIFGSSPATQHVFAQLDNEPELWNSTHLEVQGHNPITSDNYIAKTISLATALKDQFPNLVIFGPVHYGFAGIYNWQGELSASPAGNNWFPDKYLPAIQAASASYGRPLVDVYDFHWYSEATDGGGNRVISLTGAALSDAQVQAIVQSPRSLWDKTYSENSWITQVLGGPIYLLGRLQSRIDAEDPGMKISITEYNNGGSRHIAGTIAQADNLGIFGSRGLFAANLWPLGGDESYILAGFSAYRDFDGAHACFGDTSMATTSSNVQNVSVYASTDSIKPGRVVFVAINRSTSAQLTAISGAPLTGTAHLYQMTATSAAGQSPIHPVTAGTLTPTASALTVTLPPLSVTTIDVF
jgi:Glycoside hydrolase family 44